MKHCAICDRERADGLRHHEYHSYCVVCGKPIHAYDSWRADNRGKRHSAHGLKDTGKKHIDVNPIWQLFRW